MGFRALAIAMLVCRAAGAADLVVQEQPPAGFVADGDLKEWQGLPSFALGPGDLVAGPKKPSGPADFSATVWIALGKDALLIAGKVSDDKVRFPEGAKIFNADHAELWLAFPAAPLPPLAYANQFGETEVTDCAQEKDPAACDAWTKEQRRRRESLKRLFFRQYVLTPSGISEAWATAPRDGVPPEPPQKACCAASQAVVKAADGGWVFEARVDVRDFPASAQPTLRDLALMVDIADADEQIDKLESFMSSSTRRKLGRPATFNPITLRAPIVWESEPPLVHHHAAGASIFFFPAPHVQAVYAFVNHPVGYQYEPSAPSPAVDTIAIDAQKAAKLGDLNVYFERSPQGSGLFAFRGEELVATAPAVGQVLASFERDGGLHFLIYDEGTVSSLGTGMCGACPTYEVKVIALSKAGVFKEVFQATLLDGPLGDKLDDVKLDHDKTFNRFGFTAAHWGGESDKATPWKKHWRWHGGKYVPEK
jgi:hypothetical protein